MNSKFKLFFKGKTVLITGVCGTVGSEILRQIISLNPKKIIALDNNETALFYISNIYKSNLNISFLFCDIRNKNELSRKMGNVDYVIHCAALKHVPICELSPSDAIETNIIGSENIIDAAIANKVKKVIFTSSDKAVNPTNVMGTSKLMAEKLFTAANLIGGGGGAVFLSVRFGNVLGSSGSVIPIFKDQISSGKAITLTDKSMTRFIMSLSDAVHLVLNSLVIGKSGEIYIVKMPAIKILDLAEAMSELLATKGKSVIKTTGLRPGEKMYEELLNEEEFQRAFDLGDFYVLKPALSDLYSSGNVKIARQKVGEAYNSASIPLMSKKQLKDYLIKHSLV